MASAKSQKIPSFGLEAWQRVFGQSADRGKLRSMALWGAIGCLIGAVFAELLWFTAPRPSVPQKQICLLLDCSGSMFQRSGREQSMSKLEEVKIAANNFVGRQDLTNNRLAIVGFGSGARTGAPLNTDKAHLQLAVGMLNDGGGTNMSAGLLQAASELPNTADDKTERNILLFTDGQPENKAAALSAARDCREQKIRVIAIGTGDADMDYLAQVTGDPQLVFPASAGNFGESFAKAEKALHGGSLVESGASEHGFWKSLVMLVAWTALLAAGISVALIAGQNFYLRRPLLSRHELLVGGLGGLGAGSAAGLIGQVIFSIATGVASAPLISLIAPLLVLIGRVAGWLILGALVGRGLALFIPNLAPRNAWIGGAVGGALGSLAFVLASLAGDTIGRFVGAAILGALIGMMLALAEAVSRHAWLEVYFGKSESVRITLGSNLVKVGSDSRACVVYARGARPLALGYRFADNQVECIDYATEKSTKVAAGDKREVGAVTVVVCTSAQESTSAPSTAPSIAKAPLPPPAAPKLGPALSPGSPAVQPTAKSQPNTTKPTIALLTPAETAAVSKPATSETSGKARGIADSPVPTMKKPPSPAPPPQKTTEGGQKTLPLLSPTANRMISPINPPPPPKPGP